MTNRVFHTLNAILGFTYFVIAYFALQLIWWQFYPYRTATVEVPIEVLNELNQVAPGEDIQLLVIFDKQSEYTPTVSRNIICNTGSVYDVQVPTGGRSRPTGKFISEVEFKLDEDAKVGELCIFEFQNDYQVNPIRTITKKWQSEPFEIVER